MIRPTCQLISSSARTRVGTKDSDPPDAVSKGLKVPVESPSVSNGQLGTCIFFPSRGSSIGIDGGVCTSS